MGVLIDPAADRVFDDDDGPEDEAPRYSLSIGGGDLLGWAPLPCSKDAER